MTSQGRSCYLLDFEELLRGAIRAGLLRFEGRRAVARVEYVSYDFPTWSVYME